MELKDKVCIITGVSRGIGLSLTKQLLEGGAVVLGLGRTKPTIEHKNLHFVATNVRSHKSVDQAFEYLKKVLNNRLDVLINNAGLGYFKNLEDHSLDQWHEMFETNVNGIFYTCRNAIPIMKAAESGHIFNISSIAGLEAYSQVAGYCGTKFAVRGISESMYKELRGFGVKVTCVYPGSVKTDFFKNSNIEAHDYMLNPDDVAKMIVQAIQTPYNFHQVNLEIRPLQPKGPGKS